MEEHQKTIATGNNRMENDFTIAILIKPAISLNRDESVERNALLQQVFGGEEVSMVWSDTDWNVLVKVDGRLVSQLDIIDRIAFVGDHKVRLGGIGGVATLPEFRQRGLARMALANAAIFMEKKMRVDFGFLFCSPEMVAYYARFNWLLIESPVFYDQPGRKEKLDGAAMILACTQTTWPVGEVDVNGYPW